MLNLTEHKISIFHKMVRNIYIFFIALKLSDVVFILLIKVKIPTIVDLLTIMRGLISCLVELSMETVS